MPLSHQTLAGLFACGSCRSLCVAYLWLGNPGHLLVLDINIGGTFISNHRFFRGWRCISNHRFLIVELSILLLFSRRRCLVTCNRRRTSTHGQRLCHGNQFYTINMASLEKYYRKQISMTDIYDHWHVWTLLQDAYVFLESRAIISPIIRS